MNFGQSSASRAITTQYPRVSAQQLVRFLDEHYGIATRTPTLLSSEKDETYLVTDTSQRKFVVKIDSPYDDPAIAAFEAAVAAEVLHKNPELPTERHVADRAGATVTAISVGRASRQVRVLEFFEGTSLPAEDLTPALLGSIGRLQAQLHRALKDFDHPAAHRNGTLVWQVRLLPQTRGMSYALDPGLGSWLRDDITFYQNTTAPLVAQLPHQVVHNDLQPENLILSPAGDLVGVIDFGDAVRATRADDIAVTLSSLIGTDLESGLVRARHYLRGYLSEEPLPDAERRVLGMLVVARLALSVMLAHWLSAQNPSNSPYLTRLVRRFEGSYSMIHETGREQFRARMEQLFADLDEESLGPQPGRTPTS